MVIFMPKAILQFSLPEEQTEFDTVIQAGAAKSMLWDFAQQLRSWQKYDNDFIDAGDALDKIRTEFYKLISDYNISID
jgi:hypothetical protein